MTTLPSVSQPSAVITFYTMQKSCVTGQGIQREEIRLVSFCGVLVWVFWLVLFAVIQNKIFLFTENKAQMQLRVLE